MTTRRKFITTAAWVATTSLLSRSHAQTSADITTLPDGIGRTDLFLLLGQSNMKGRGVIPSNVKPDPRILMMRMQEDRWYVAQDPLHARVNPKSDRPDNAGVGPG